MLVFFELRLIKSGFLDTGGKIHADMQARRQFLVIVNDLEFQRRLEGARITFRGVIGMANDISCSSLGGYCSMGENETRNYTEY